MRFEPPHTRLSGVLTASVIMCLSPEPREGKGRGIYPAGSTAIQIRAGEFQGPLRYPTFLRTEVRAPFARAATTLNRYIGEGNKDSPPLAFDREEALGIPH